MHGSLKKYFSQSTDGSGNKLYWPGTIDGYPVRGMPSLTTDREYSEIPVVYDAKCAILELPADQARYEEIIDKCANGWFHLRHEKIDYDTAKGVYRVFLQWLEIYGENTGVKSPHFPALR